MTVRYSWLIGIAAALLLWGCEQQPAVAPDAADGVHVENAGEALPAEMALAVVEAAGWTIADRSALPEGVTEATLEKGPKYLRGWEREVIAGDIAHYTFYLQVGPGQYDVIGIHRVVKEDRPGRPIHTRDNIFLQHGDAKDFTGMFLPGSLSPTTPDDFGFAVFMAENGVDVWGIDQAWTLVPEEETDFTFMANWGMERQIGDLDLALAVARFVRAVTGNGLRKMILSGYSSGVTSTSAWLNTDVQRPRGLRQVNGYIPVDLMIKSPPDRPDLTQFLIEYRDIFQDLIDNGIYQDNIPFRLLARLAADDPDGPSPIPGFEGFTNLQTAYFYASGPLYGFIPFHYWTANWENGLPVDLVYTDDALAFDFLYSGVPYEPLRFYIDQHNFLADVVDVPWDDHLSQVDVPVLNVMPAGGFGELALYGIALLGSTDVTQLLIQLKPPADILYDFGHIDVFTAGNAEQLAWQPMLNWIQAYSD